MINNDFIVFCCLIILILTTCAGEESNPLRPEEEFTLQLDTISLPAEGIVTFPQKFHLFDNVLYYSSQEKGAEHLYRWNITRESLVKLGPENTQLPYGFNTFNFLPNDEGITLIGGQLELIELTPDLTVKSQLKTKVRAPYFWADNNFFERWNHHYLTGLSLPPIPDFPGMISLIAEDGRQGKVFGSVPDYLKGERSEFRDYRGFMADIENDRVFVKYQFDTLIHVYRLPDVDRSEQLSIPAPTAFQPTPFVQEIATNDVDLSVLWDESETRQRNACFVWFHVRGNYVHYIYRNFPNDGKEAKYELYSQHLSTGTLQVRALDDWLPPPYYFSKDVVVSWQATDKRVILLRIR